jgi:hypothetical protein
MPTYCYENGVERVFPIGKAPQCIMHGGRFLKRSYAAEQKSVPAAKGWPMTCVASGVNAAQAGELRDHLARAGVPTEVTSDGDPVYTSAKHRRKALKARGLFDRSSFV